MSKYPKKQVVQQKQSQQTSNIQTATVQSKPKEKVQTLDQKRANWAWEETFAERARKDDKAFKAYTNLVKGSGAMIMQNGLMATLAFYGQKAFSKKETNSADGGKEHQTLLLQLCSKLIKKPIKTKEEYAQFMSLLSKTSSIQYRQLTEESLALVRWLRHFASALNKEGDNK